MLIRDSGNSPGEATETVYGRGASALTEIVYERSCQVKVDGQIYKVRPNKWHRCKG